MTGQDHDVLQDNAEAEPEKVDQSSEETASAPSDDVHVARSSLTEPVKAFMIPQDEHVAGQEPGAQANAKGPSTFRRQPPLIDLAAIHGQTLNPSGAKPRAGPPDEADMDIDDSEPAFKGFAGTADSSRLQNDQEISVLDRGAWDIGALGKHDRQDDESQPGAPVTKKACQGQNGDVVGFTQRKRRPRGT